MATQPPNFQPPPAGYGSYLKGILPDDLAVAAGSFAAAIQQVINVKEADFEKFSQVAASIEVTNTNLPLINGTDVPVNLQKTAENTIINALGSGPHGTYTASDFFGCMSGLPYNWRELQNNILAGQTTKLTNIYQELFLAVTWEGAVVDVILETRTVGTPPSTYTEYRCAGFSVTSKGGGYGRGTAPDPIITASNGGSGLGIVGRSPPGAQSVGGGSYGRLTGCSLTNAGSWQLSPPTVTSIEYPPTATLPVQASGAKSTGGSNTAYLTVGWPSPMNAVTQQYIDQANAEIRYIAATKSGIVKTLNAIYHYNGKQLEIEQRCRYRALDPVPIPRDRWLSTYPTSISSFVDAISTYAQSTRPHMYAQTLEAISDLKNVCGQSAVGLMRQERNVERLQKINVSVENNIPGKIETELEKPLIANGTLPVGRKGSGIEVTGVNGNNNDPITTYTAPSTLVQQLAAPTTVAPPVGAAPNTNIVAPKPRGYFSPKRNRFIKSRKIRPLIGTKPVTSETVVPVLGSVGKILSIQNISPNRNINLLGPSGDGTGPPRPVTPVAAIDPGTLQGGVSITSPFSPTASPTLAGVNPANPIAGTGVPGGPNGSTPGTTSGTTPGAVTTATGTPLPGSLPGNALNSIEFEPIVVVSVGAESTDPEGDEDQEILDDGSPDFPGSLAGSPDTNFLPPQLNTAYTSSVLLPSTLSVDEAIDEVVKCNCDCWVD